MADTKLSALPAKTTPAAADIIPILDSAASNANARTTFAGAKNFLLQPEASHPYRQTFTIPKTTDVAAKYGEAVPWQIETGYSDFVGQTYSDPIFCAGYNVDIALGKKDTNEPGVGYFVEGDYWDSGISARTAELYCQYLETASTAQIRPWFYQINRGTNRIVTAHIQIPVANPLAFNLCDGTTTGAPQVAALTSDTFTLQQIVSNGVASVDIRGRASNPTDGTGRLRIGYGSNQNAIQLSAETATQSTIALNNGTTVIRMYQLNSSGVVCIGGNDNAASLTLDGVNVNSGNKGLVVRRHASATAAAVQVQNSSSTTLWEIDGNLNTIPAAGSASMTQGFTYIPSGAGAAGTPGTLPTGRVPMYVDTTGNRIGVYYGGSWKYAAVS